ncbi:MAG: hypothetical protein JRG84_16520, partial [Deltaproteobacteria bacterium]|nr:hypothetical protein [Deltaproteobacteria bacterium]
DSIDSWIDTLGEQTSLSVSHTFGTTGKLSFLPRGHSQWYEMIRIMGNYIRDWHGNGQGPDLFKNHLPFIQPHYRDGAAAVIRGTLMQIEVFSGGADNALFLFPDRMSADVASLAGRIRVAEARGERGRLQIPKALLAKREEFIRREQERPERMKKFFEQAIARFGGQPVILCGVWPIFFDAAEEALRLGVREVFAPGSVLIAGGGSKGRELPENWREMIFEFLGFRQYYEIYSMSELMASCPACEEGRYHIPPVIVPFLLDPKTGEALPRAGKQTGRFAFLDLLPDNYWGGLVSGDEVSMGGWDEPCSCGRQGPFMEREIRRYSDKEGGDDKISCAGAQEAHDNAIAYIIEAGE